MEQGYICLWRKSLDSGLIKNHNVWIFWTWCLLKANHKPNHKQIVGFQEVFLQPGEFVFGRKAASEEIGLSEQNIRTCLKFLEKSKNLTIKSTNKFSIISIINWDVYQYSKNENNQQNNQHLTSIQPASNHKQEHNNKINNNIADSHESASLPQEDFYLTNSGKKLTGKRLVVFNQFWEAFGFKKGKAAAAAAWLKIPVLTDAIAYQIISSAKIEASNRQALIDKGQSPKWAQGWLIERRWEDEAYLSCNNEPKPETKEQILKRHGLSA